MPHSLFAHFLLGFPTVLEGDKVEKCYIIISLPTFCGHSVHVLMGSLKVGNVMGNSSLFYPRQLVPTRTTGNLSLLPRLGWSGLEKMIL